MHFNKDIDKTLIELGSHLPFHHNLSDSRHQDIIIIDESFSDQRVFPEWGMGYVNNQESIKNILESITGSREFDPSILTPQKAILILLHLSKII